MHFSFNVCFLQLSHLTRHSIRDLTSNWHIRTIPAFKIVHIRNRNQITCAGLLMRYSFFTFPVTVNAYAPTNCKRMNRRLSQIVNSARFGALSLILVLQPYKFLQRSNDAHRKRRHRAYCTLTAWCSSSVCGLLHVCVFPVSSTSIHHTYRRHIRHSAVCIHRAPANATVSKWYACVLLSFAIEGNPSGRMYSAVQLCALHSSTILCLRKGRQIFCSIKSVHIRLYRRLTRFCRVWVCVCELRILSQPDICTPRVYEIRYLYFAVRTIAKLKLGFVMGAAENKNKCRSPVR